MKNEIILNIPHSSLKLPKEFLKREKLLSSAEIQIFNKQMTDLFTDEIFSCKNYKCIKAKYSRIACDVEKFLNEELEEMAKFGLGVFYKNNLKKQPIFNKKDEKYEKNMLNKYYYPYHRALNKIIIRQIRRGKKVLLVDCHSFSREIVIEERRSENLPDICLGYNESFCEEKVVKFTYDYFAKLGYSVELNHPYSGAMVPTKLLNAPNPNFSSLMIEINRDIYLKKNEKSSNFNKIQCEIKKLLELLKYC